MANYRIRAAGKTLEMFIYDDIGETWFSSGITARQIAQDLKDAGKVDLINIRLNSAGGSVPDGVAIFNQLERNSARIEIDIDGMALSIASIIAMAGDEIRMAKNAMFMIHDPWGLAMGSAAELRKEADVMDQYKQGLVRTYADRTKLDDTEVSDLMSDETWYTASEAYEAGFVDSVSDDMRIAAKFDPKRFKNVPVLAQQRAGQVATPLLDLATARLERLQKRIAGRV